MLHFYRSPAFHQKALGPLRIGSAAFRADLAVLHAAFTLPPFSDIPSAFFQMNPTPSPGGRLRDRPQEGRRADRAQLRKQLLGGTVGKIQYLVIEPLEGVHAARRGDDQIPVRQIDAGQRVDTGRADHVAQVAGNLAHAVLARVSSRAMSEAAERIERLQGAAVRVGYRKEDLKTTSFDVQTRYENVKDRQGNYKREFVGYACSYRLKLAFDFDSKQLAKVISAIADCGAQPELSIAFTVKNPARVSEELLINATENARAKAEILCKASGSTLGQLLNIDYNWGELNVFSRTSYDVEDCIQPLMAMSKCAAPEIEPVDIDVTDTVAFTWEIQ